MTIQPTSFKPVSAGPATASHTPDARAGAPKFTRPAPDGIYAQSAHSAASVAWGAAAAAAAAAANIPNPAIDPSASPEEKNLFMVASDLSNGTLESIAAKLMMLYRSPGEPTSTQEPFTFGQKPASVQTKDSRIVIHVGSDDDGSAGMVSLVGGRVDQAKGVLQDPANQISAIQKAGTALFLGFARRNNLSHAAAAIESDQRYNAFMEEYRRLNRA